MYRSLDVSLARWNVVAQQIMIGRVDRTNGKAVAYSMDQWPGYEADRQRLLKYFASGRVKNPVVITGDIHTNYVNDLQVNSSNTADPVVATEFVGTSISSGGDGAEATKTTPGVLAENPFVKFCNNERGYVTCDVTPDRWTSHYRTVPYVSKPGAPIVTRRTFVVESGRAGAQQA